MVILYIFVGTIAGFIAAAVSVILGATLWRVLIAYIASGALGVLLAAMFLLVRSYIVNVRRKQEDRVTRIYELAGRTQETFADRKYRHSE